MGAGEGAKQVKVLATKFQPAQKETIDFASCVLTSSRMLNR